MKIPKFLKKRGRRFYQGVLDDFVFEKIHDFERLAQAAGELDTQDEAQAMIDRDGYYLTNRYGKLVEHPAIKTLRDSRSLFLKICRELSLDLVKPDESRPPRLY